MNQQAKLMKERDIKIFFQDFENFKLDYVDKLENYQIRGIFCYACKNKTVDGVKFICEKLIVHENFEKFCPDYHTEGFEYACDGNNLDVMNYLNDNYVIDPNIYSYHSILFYPCINNNFDVVKFIINNFPKLNYRPYRRELINCCCAHGCHKILYYLKSKYPDFDEDIDHNRWLIKGDQEFKKWFRAGCPIHTNIKMNKLYKCLDYNQMETFFQNFEKFKIDYVGKLKKYQIGDLYDHACKYKTTDEVKFFCEKMIVHENFEKFYPNYHTHGFKYACMGNNLDVMNYLYDNYVIDPNIFSDNIILSYPCVKGFFDVVKFIVDNFPNLNYRPNRRDLIRVFCSHGEYQIFYYLKSKYPDFDEDIDHKNYLIASHDEAFIEWFRAGCPIHTNMNPTKK